MPRVAQPVTVQGWDLSGSVLARMKRNGPEAVLNFLPVPHTVYRDEDDEVRGFAIRFEWPDGPTREATVPARVIRAARPADVIADAGGPDLAGPEAKVIVELLCAVRDGLSSAVEERVVTRAEWRDGRLSVPGYSGRAGGWRTELAAYGERADVSEDEARAAWAEVIGLARAEPKLVLTLGMPLGSVYTVPLEADAFAVHLTGESHSGKTEAGELAMSTLSSARRPHGKLYRTWNMSEQAPANLLKRVGVLPVWFDEAATSGLDNEGFTRLLFRLAQGRARVVADTEGGLREGSDERWTSCVLSTGEARLSTRSGLTGLRRRVLEVYAPLVAGARGEQLHGQLLERARRAYGWPLWWTAADPDLPGALRTFHDLFGHLAESARGQQVEVAQAANVAVCVTGFRQLARAAGISVPARELRTRAAWVFERLMRAAEEEGADVGERGLRAIKEALQTTSNFCPPEADIFVRRWGVYYEDGYVGILGEATLAMILEEFGGLPDPQPVLEKWAEHGILRHDPGTYTARRGVFVPAKGRVVQSRLYLIRVAGSRDTGGGS